MSRITDLVANTSLGTADLLVVVDVDDTTMASTGTDKKLTVAQLLGFPAHSFSTPVSPSATGSTSLVMMGLGGTFTITPASSGTVQATINGQLTTATGVATISYAPRFGTGGAPANGAAVTGTNFGAVGTFTTQAPATNANVPMSITGLVTLTPGTAYWFDLALATSSGADAASFTNPMFTAVEIA